MQELEAKASALPAECQLTLFLFFFVCFVFLSFYEHYISIGMDKKLPTLVSPTEHIGCEGLAGVMFSLLVRH